MTLTTREGISIFFLSVQEDVCIGIGYTNRGLNRPIFLTAPDHKLIGVICDVRFLRLYANVWRVF